MPEGPVFTPLQVYPKMVGKFLRPKPLTGMVRLRKLAGPQQDSIGALLERRAAQTPDSIGFRDRAGSATWREIDEASNRVADVLARRGVVKGDVVAVSMENRLEWITAVMGVMKLGAIASLINTALRSKALEHCVTVVGPKAFLVGEEQVSSVQDAAAVLAWAPDVFFVSDAGTATCPDGWSDLAEEMSTASAGSRPELAAVMFDDPAIYVYTSGTTGLPKASINVHRRLFLGCIVSGRVLRELGPDDCAYVPTPLFHVSGILGGWCACLYTGATLATTRKFSATRFWDDIRDFDATTFGYIGELLRYLYNQPPSPRDREHKVRSMMGAGLRFDMWDEFKDRFGIEKVYELYGASESPGGFTNLFALDKTCGWCPTPWVAAKYDVENDEIVRSAEGRASAMGKGEVGLLLFKIDKHAPFTGYTDPEATEKKVLRDVFEPDDQWFNSGDLVLNQGYGHMRFIDRVGDTYRWRGENVATTEVELAVDAWPQVAECAVYGVEVPGAEGRCGMVRIVLVPGEELDLHGFAAYLRQHLPGYAVPRFLRLGQEIEVTQTFKQRKGELRNEGYSATDGERVLLLAPDDDVWRDLEESEAASIASGELRL